MSNASRIENEDREPDQSLLEALECHARVALSGPAVALEGAVAAGGEAAATTSSAGGRGELGGGGRWGELEKVGQGRRNHAAPHHTALHCQPHNMPPTISLPQRNALSS